MTVTEARALRLADLWHSADPVINQFSASGEVTGELVTAVARLVRLFEIDRAEATSAGHASSVAEMDALLAELYELHAYVTAHAN